MAVHDERTVVLLFRLRGYAKMKSRQLRLPYAIGLHPKDFFAIERLFRTGLPIRHARSDCRLVTGRPTLQRQFFERE